jgi:hypothetical protein
MTTLSILKTYFYIEQDSVDINDNMKYKKYSDLYNLTNDELWAHANQYGYKEQRQIFYDCSYNEAFYSLYLSTYRDAVLNVNSYFDWLVYSKSCQLTIKSEYYALLHYIENNNIDINAIITSTSETTNVYVYNKLHYSIIAECGMYDYKTFPYAYGAGQWSSENFGIIVPYDSTLLRGYLMYYYEDFSIYNTSANRDDYIYNHTKVKIKLDLYINGVVSDYYIEETLDPSKNMMGILYKYRKEENNLTHNIDYNTIYLQENSIISWYCSELIATDLCGNYTNYPYNPTRNRLINILEPSNNFVVSDSISSNINIDSEMNAYSTNAVQNKVILSEINKKQNLITDLSSEKFIKAGSNITFGYDGSSIVIHSSTTGTNDNSINSLQTNIDNSFSNTYELLSNIDTSVNTLDSSMNNIYGLINILDNSINYLEEKIDYSFNNIDISNELFIKNINVYDKLIDLSDNQNNLINISDVSGLQTNLDNKQSIITTTTDLNIQDLSCNNLTGNSLSSVNLSTDNFNGYTTINIVAIAKVLANGNNSRVRGCSVTHDSTGQYICTFTSELPTNNYCVQLTVVESISDRDDIIITLNENSTTTTSFSYSIHEQDNDGDAGTYVDRIHFVSVFL